MAACYFLRLIATPIVSLRGYLPGLSVRWNGGIVAPDMDRVETAQAGRLRASGTPRRRRSRVKLLAREHLMIAHQPIQKIAPTYVRQDRPVVLSRRPLHLGPVRRQRVTFYIDNVADIGIGVEHPDAAQAGKSPDRLPQCGAIEPMRGVVQTNPRPLTPIPDGIFEHGHAPAIQLKRASHAKICGDVIRRRLFYVGDEHALWLPSQEQLSHRVCDLANMMLYHAVGNTQKPHPIGRPAQTANRLDRFAPHG